MEDASAIPTSEDAWAQEIAETLSHERSRVREFLVSQRARLDQAQTQLSGQIEQISESLDRERAETDHARQEIEDRSEQVQGQIEALANLKEELDARQARWEITHREAIGQYESLAERLKRQQEAQVDDLSAQLKTQIDEQSTRLRQQAEELRDALAGQKELAAKLEAARRRETELSDRIEVVGRQRDQLREEAAQAGGVNRARLEALQAERDKLASELRDGVAGQKELAAEIEAAKRREAELNERIEILGRQHDRLREEAGQAAKAGGVDHGRLEALQAERDELAEQLGETQRRLAVAVDRLAEVEQQLARAAGARNDSDDLQRRYEMAMEDLRELNQRNSELEQELARVRTARPPAPSGGALDWEAEKRRLLASLDAEVGAGDEDDQTRRLEMEDVVQKTETIVAEKDREIRELKQLLESQSAVHDSVALGAAALGKALDQDALIQEEREKLRQLQKEWEEKLRQAELEVSVERAKLARERSQIEERLRLLEERAGQAGADSSGASKASAEPKRGRWLARLGLKDSQDE